MGSKQIKIEPNILQTVRTGTYHVRVQRNHKVITEYYSTLKGAQKAKETILAHYAKTGELTHSPNYKTKRDRDFEKHFGLSPERNRQGNRDRRSVSETCRICGKTVVFADYNWYKNFQAHKHTCQACQMKDPNRIEYLAEKRRKSDVPLKNNKISIKNINRLQSGYYVVAITRHSKRYFKYFTNLEDAITHKKYVLNYYKMHHNFPPKQ